MTRKEYYKDWYQKNRARNLAVAKAWRKANPGKRAIISKRWRSKVGADKIKSYNKAWREANKDRIKAKREANKEKIRAWRTQKTYGISAEDMSKLLSEQAGCCAICRKPSSDFSRGLHVDHDHSTHLVRGLLCWGCNSLLPSRKDLMNLLQRAIGYLASPPAVRAIGERFTPGRRKKIPSIAEPELPFS